MTTLSELPPELRVLIFETLSWSTIITLFRLNVSLGLEVANAISIIRADDERQIIPTKALYHFPRVVAVEPIIQYYYHNLKFLERFKDLTILVSSPSDASLVLTKLPRSDNRIKVIDADGGYLEWNRGKVIRKLPSRESSHYLVSIIKLPITELTSIDPVGSKFYFWQIIRDIMGSTLTKATYRLEVENPYPIIKKCNDKLMGNLTYGFATPNQTVISLLFPLTSDVIPLIIELFPQLQEIGYSDQSSNRLIDLIEAYPRITFVNMMI